MTEPIEPNLMPTAWATSLWRHSSPRSDKYRVSFARSATFTSAIADGTVNAELNQLRPARSQLALRCPLAWLHPAVAGNRSASMNDRAHRGQVYCWLCI